MKSCDVPKLVHASHDIVEEGVRQSTVPDAELRQLVAVRDAIGDVVRILLCQTEHGPSEVNSTSLGLEAKDQLVEIGKQWENHGEVKMIGWSQHVNLIRKFGSRLRRGGPRHSRQGGGGPGADNSLGFASEALASWDHDGGGQQLGQLQLLHNLAYSLGQLFQVGHVRLAGLELLHVELDGLLDTHPLPAEAVLGHVTARVQGLAPPPPVEAVLQPVVAGDQILRHTQLGHQQLLVVASEAVADDGFPGEASDQHLDADVGQGGNTSVAVPVRVLTGEVGGELL